jgi:hypothetical protein
MQNILIICPTQRDMRELEKLRHNSDYHFMQHAYATNTLYKFVAQNRFDCSETIKHPEVELFDILAIYSQQNLHGVLSTNDYPGSSLAPIIAHHLNLPGSNPMAALLCQHKLYARQQQKLILPQCTPNFEGFVPGEKPTSLNVPFFVKPIKGFCSIATKTVHSELDLNGLKDLCPPKKFFELFDYLLQTYAQKTIGTNFLLAEELLQGTQVTVDGFVYKNKPSILGIVDSIMIPGTISFDRFEYPSSLDQNIQKRIKDITIKLIKSIELAHGLFNVEFIYNQQNDTIHIVEINPRMSSQFADLYEKVDGTNTYQIALDLAIGKQPQPQQKNGPHKKAAACILRSPSNKQVVRLPNAQEYSHLNTLFPDMRIEVFAIVDTRLSEQHQDGDTFRYAGINLGGRDLQDILEKFEYCKQHLTFEFQVI